MFKTDPLRLSLNQAWFVTIKANHKPVCCARTLYERFYPYAQDQPTKPFHLCFTTDPAEASPIAQRDPASYKVSDYLADLFESNKIEEAAEIFWWPEFLTTEEAS